MPAKGQTQEKRPCEICGKMVGRSGYTGHLRTHQTATASANSTPIKMPMADVEPPATVMQAALHVIEASNNLQKLLLLELTNKKVA